MSRFEFLEDVVGVNKSRVKCHPYKGLVGPKKGKFSYTLKTEDNKDFKSATAEELIKLIEAGAFDVKGRIRMLPADGQHSKGNSALSVVSYKGQRLPLVHGFAHAVADRDLEALNAKNVVASPSGKVLDEIQSRLPAEQLRKVTPEYIWGAVQALIEGTPANGYKPSVDYDLLVDDGMRLAPKQVFGLAASAALGMDIKPVHFTGGVGTVCFEMLEAAGFKIVLKDEQVESVEIPADTDERDWAEGQVKLVYHLKRERSPGLSKAKKASFIKKYGRLFCEECGIDPIETYGDFGEACIEVHHDAIQVANMGKNHKTTLDQLRCLCANCHRIVHRSLKSRLLHFEAGGQNESTPFSE
jgi:hypothetical protein